MDRIGLTDIPKLGGAHAPHLRRPCHLLKCMTTHCFKKVLKDLLDEERMCIYPYIKVQGFDRQVDIKMALCTSFEELDGNSIDLIT